MANVQSEDAYTNSLLTDFDPEDNFTQKPCKSFELSSCRIWISILLSMVYPIAAYVHTRRLVPFLKLVGFSFVAVLTLQVVSQTTLEDSEDMQILAGVGMSIAAAVDNTGAIKKARKEKTGHLAA